MEFLPTCSISRVVCQGIERLRSTRVGLQLWPIRQVGELKTRANSQCNPTGSLDLVLPNMNMETPET